MGVLSRRKVDVQPTALDFANGLVGEGNFTAEETWLAPGRRAPSSGPRAAARFVEVECGPAGPRIPTEVQAKLVGTVSE